MSAPLLVENAAGCVTLASGLNLPEGSRIEVFANRLMVVLPNGHAVVVCEPFLTMWASARAVVM